MTAPWLFPVSSAGPRRPRNSGGPVVFRTCRLTKEDASDTARLTEKMRSVELLARAAFRQAFHEAHLEARREALIGTLAHLRRKHRSTCDAMADLRAVTHELLAWRRVMGDGKSKTIQQMIDDHGLTVGGIAMLVQIAEFLEAGPITLDGKARDDTLAWLAQWRESVKP